MSRLIKIIVVYFNLSLVLSDSLTEEIELLQCKLHCRQNYYRTCENPPRCGDCLENHELECSSRYHGYQPINHYNVGSEEQEIEALAQKGHQGALSASNSENDDYNAAEYVGKPSAYKFRVHQIPVIAGQHIPFSILKKLGLTTGSEQIPDAAQNIRNWMTKSDRPAKQVDGLALNQADPIPGELDFEESLRQNPGHEEAVPYNLDDADYNLYMNRPEQPWDEDAEGSQQLLEQPDSLEEQADLPKQYWSENEDEEDSQMGDDPGHNDKNFNVETRGDDEEDGEQGEHEEHGGDEAVPHPPAPAALKQDRGSSGKPGLHAVNSMADVYFLAVVAGCSVAGVVGLVVAGVCWYRLQKNVKAASEVDYPAYGVTGPTKERVGSPGDRKLAQSAQMYHYQHQKQQMIAMEKAHNDLHKDGSEVDSEEENEEGDYTVFECPGLAPTGEMEVKNPLFSEDTPVTPSGGDTQGEQHK